MRKKISLDQVQAGDIAKAGNGKEYEVFKGLLGPFIMINALHASPTVEVAHDALGFTFEREVPEEPRMGKWTDEWACDCEGMAGTHFHTVTKCYECHCLRPELPQPAQEEAMQPEQTAETSDARRVHNHDAVPATPAPRVTGSGPMKTWKAQVNGHDYSKPPCRYASLHSDYKIGDTVFVCDRDPNKVFPEWLKSLLKLKGGFISATQLRFEILEVAREAGLEVPE